MKIVECIPALDGKGGLFGQGPGKHWQGFVVGAVLTGKEVIDKGLLGRGVMLAIFPAVTVQQPDAGRTTDEAFVIDGDKRLFEPGVLQKNRKGIEFDRLLENLVARCVGQKIFDLFVDFAMGTGGKSVNLGPLDRTPYEIWLTKCCEALGRIGVKDQVFGFLMESDLVQQGFAMS